MSIKEEFKDLFWSSLTEQEIKDEIGLTHREYHDLLRECKLELGLPTSYRRNPARWDMYNINSYFIIYYFDDDFKIIKYSPTLRSAELDLEKYLKDNPDYYDGEFEIKKASDENIGELIFY